MCRTADLVPYARNARTHTDAQIAQIMGSIREFGWTNPVLIDAENGLITGHGRVLAAHKLRIEQVPCLVLSNFTATQARAYRIVDNQLALNAGWDAEMLRLELADLKLDGFDLALTGFDDLKLKSFMDEPEFAPGSEEDQGRLDEKKKVHCPNCHHEFIAP